MADTSWLQIAKRYLGLKEYPGAKTSPTIAGWLARLKTAWRDDETSWCGSAVADWFLEAGIDPVKGFAGARNWMNFGVNLAGPAVGCVVVFWRGSPSGWQGHVGLVVGRDQNGNLMVLGGNQGDAVSIKPFLPLGVKGNRVLGYRWPANYPIPTVGFSLLPVVKSDGKLSTNEA